MRSLTQIAVKARTVVNLLLSTPHGNADVRAETPITYKPVKDPALKADLSSISDVMWSRGINTDPGTGLTFFTGYSYLALND